MTDGTSSLEQGINPNEAPRNLQEKFVEQVLSQPDIVHHEKERLFCTTQEGSDDGLNVVQRKYYTYQPFTTLDSTSNKFIEGDTARIKREGDHLISLELVRRGQRGDSEELQAHVGHTDEFNLRYRKTRLDGIVGAGFSPKGDVRGCWFYKNEVHFADPNSPAINPDGSVQMVVRDDDQQRNRVSFGGARLQLAKREPQHITLEGIICELRYNSQSQRYELYHVDDTNTKLLMSLPEQISTEQVLSDCFTEDVLKDPAHASSEGDEWKRVSFANVLDIKFS